MVFGVYLLVSGIAQAIAAFTVGLSPGSRVLFFISGALSVVLGYFAFRDFNNGAAVWMLAIWIGVGFIFQGVTATALAIDVPALPARGWYIFVGILTVIAGVVTIVWPISSIVVLAIIAGVMARRHRDHRSCVGTERASHSQEKGAPYRGVVGAQRRQLTHLGVLRRNGASQHTEPMAAEGLDTTTSRAQGDWHIPQLVPRGLLRTNQVHHPAVLDEANRRSDDIQLR